MSDTVNKGSTSDGLRRPAKASASQKLPAAQPLSNPSDSGSMFGGITPTFVLRAIRQWWKVAIPLGVTLAAIAAAVVWSLFEPQFESRAILRIKDTKPVIVYPSRDNSRRFERTQVELMKSSLVIEQVLSQPDIARFEEILSKDSPGKWIASRITIAALRGSDLYIIKYASRNAEHSAAIVNAVADVYFSMQEAEESRQTTQVIALLGVEKDRHKLEVAHLRKNVSVLAKDITGVNPFSGIGRTVFSLSSPLAVLHQRLIDAEVEREFLNATATAFEASLKDGDVTVPVTLVDRAVERQADVQRISREILANGILLEEIADAHVRGDKAPSYQRLAHVNQKLRDKLQQLRKTLGKQFTEEIGKQELSARKDQLAQMKAQLSSGQFKEQLLRDRYEKMIADVSQSSGLTMELEFLRAELEREERVLDLISSRIVQLLTEIRAPARVTLLQPAKAATVPIERTPLKQMGFAGLIGFLLPFGVVVFWEKIVCRVNDSKQLELSNLEVVGEIATIPSRSRVWALSSKTERGLNIYEESVDSLRTSLVLSEQAGDMRVLAVTSAISREGKTSLASQLAVSIARASGELTLLIDGDMRSPDMHNVFDIDNDKGLAQVLSGECEVDEAIVTNWSSHLHLLPAGILKSSPHKLLGRDAFGRSLTQLREKYRYIVIDTPPILSASESLILAKSADATLLCTMREVSRLDQVTAAFERLTASGARPVGTVLNGVPASRYAYRYGTYTYPHS